MEKTRVAKIAGIITTAAVGIGVALGGCEYTEEKIAGVVGDEAAKVVLDTSCAGGPDFLKAAVEGTSPLVAELIRQGAISACLARTTNTISATVYDSPLVEFCKTTEPLTAETEPDANVRRRALPVWPFP